MHSHDILIRQVEHSFIRISTSFLGIVDAQNVFQDLFEKCSIWNRADYNFAEVTVASKKKARSQKSSKHPQAAPNRFTAKTCQIDLIANI